MEFFSRNIEVLKLGIMPPPVLKGLIALAHTFIELAHPNSAEKLHRLYMLPHEEEDVYWLSFMYVHCTLYTR